MSDATSQGYGGMFTSLLGGITSAIGAFSSGQSQKELYDYQAGVAKLNSQIAEQNASYAIQVGGIQAANAGLKGGQEYGQVKVAQSASGLDVNSGSATQVRASQREITGVNQAAIVSNAAKTAYNYKVEGVQFGAQASLDTLAGQNSATAGFVNAASSIVGAASSVSSQWQRGQQLGLWGSPSGNASQSFGN